MKPEKTDTARSRFRILSTLKNKCLTINEIIDTIHTDDIRTGKINSRSWKYYVHLNKLFSTMETQGLIKVTGTIIGPTNKTEKQWSIQ